MRLGQMGKRGPVLLEGWGDGGAAGGDGGSVEGRRVESTYVGWQRDLAAAPLYACLPEPHPCGARLLLHSRQVVLPDITVPVFPVMHVPDGCTYKASEGTAAGRADQHGPPHAGERWANTAAITIAIMMILVVLRQSPSRFSFAGCTEHASIRGLQPRRP